jgi:putative ABC transport system permease protein
MNPLDSLSLAIKNLRNRRLRSWLTMIGIFIGIAAVVSLIGLGEGLRVGITSQFGFLGSDTLSIRAEGLDFAGPPGSSVVTPLDPELTNKIERINGVEVSIDRYLESGTLEFNDRLGIGLAMSIPSGSDRKALEEMANLKTVKGRMLKDGDGRKLVLGINFYEDKVGFGKGVNVGDRVLLNGFKYEVVGILEKKGSFIFDNAVFVNEDIMLEELRERTDQVDVIAVKVKDVGEIEKVKEDIEKLLRKERGVKLGEEDFVVESPQQTLDQLNDILFGVQLFVTIIAIISLLVGGIGIMNTMYTSVLERRKDIGIMKSIGARNSNIFWLFFIESGYLGLVGGVIGIALGLGLAYGLAAFGRAALGGELIQASVSLELIIGALLFSFILGTIFGTLPAVQASKLQPVESLRSVK